MPAQTLTTEFMMRLSSLVPPAGSVSYFDTDIKGFLLELRSSGGATFYFRYRDATGKIRLSRIGRADHEPVVEQLRRALVDLERWIAEYGHPANHDNPEEVEPLARRLEELKIGFRRLYYQIDDVQLPPVGTVRADGAVHHAMISAQADG